jgi:hypothetical protein
MESERWLSDDGDEFWYLIPVDSNKYHRVDGPAVKLISGKEFWFYNGIEVKCSSLEEFTKKIKLLAFL